MTLADALNIFSQTHGLNPQTAERYSHLIGLVIPLSTKVTTITHLNAHNDVGNRYGSLTDKKYIECHKALVHFFGWLEARGHAQHFVRNLPHPKPWRLTPPVLLTWEQFLRLQQIVPEMPLEFVVHELITQLGFSPQEIVSLTPDDIVVGTSNVAVRARNDNGKEINRLEVSRHTAAWLKQFPSSTGRVAFKPVVGLDGKEYYVPNPSPPIFSLSITTIKRWMNKWAKQARIKGHLDIWRIRYALMHYHRKSGTPSLFIQDLVRSREFWWDHSRTPMREVPGETP